MVPGTNLLASKSTTITSQHLLVCRRTGGTPPFQARPTHPDQNQTTWSPPARHPSTSPALHKTDTKMPKTRIIHCVPCRSTSPRYRRQHGSKSPFVVVVQQDAGVEDAAEGQE